MGVLVLQKTNKNPVSFSALTSVGSTRTDGPFVLGMKFKVLAESRLISIGRSKAFSAPPALQCGIYNSDTQILLSSAFITPSGPGTFPTPVTLKTGVTYMAVIVYPNTYAWDQSPDPSLPANPPYPITGLELGSYWLPSATLVFPTNTNTTIHHGEHILNVEYDNILSSEVPPEPDTQAVAKQFIISLPKDWLPKGLMEWDLQFQKGSDDTLFGDWKDLGTFTANADDANVFTHSSLDVVNLPYYRYRYRLRTATQESAWSEPANAGLVKNTVVPEDIQGQIDGGSGIAPGSIGSGQIGEGAITATQIAANSITAGAIAAGSITANALQASSVTAGAIAAGSITAGALQAGSVTATAISAGSIVAGSIATGAITAGTIAAGAINATDLIVDGLINGNHIGPGVINGVHIQDGAITAVDIATGTLTSQNVTTDFLDANLSAAGYLEANAIKGGELNLGGPRIYQYFKSSGLSLMFPWSIQGTALSSTSYPGGADVAAPKFIASWGSTMRVDLVNGAGLIAGETVTFMHTRASSNPIQNAYIHVKTNLPASTILEVVDQDGAVRPLAAPFTKTGAYETPGSSTDTETLSIASDPTLPSSLGFQLRCTSNTTVPSTGYYIEVSIVQFNYLKGSGVLSLFDFNGILRGELTADHIQFNKIVSGMPEKVFYVDSTGVWVPDDGLTIGSTKIPSLSYNMRDLSGSLAVNPRFENLRMVVDPNDSTKVSFLPSDWTYLPAESNFGYNEGVLPQWQSLVGGKTLKAILPNGSTSGTTARQAISHKRYVAPDAAAGLPQVPLAMSAYFRCDNVSDKSKVQVKLSLYSSTNPNDLVAVPGPGDTLLGTTTASGSLIGSLTVDNQVAFQRVSLDYRGLNTMQVSTGSYIYMVIETSVSTGTLGQQMNIEWDNVDLGVAEAITPSDNQIEAELAKRISDLQNIFGYMLSGTKAILPELDGSFAAQGVAQGTQGLILSVVN